MRSIIAALCVTLLATTAGTAFAPPWDRIAQDKVRGAYFGQGLGREHYQKLGDAGFNAVFVKYGGLGVLNPAGDTADAEHMKNAAAWARECGLRFFPVINFGGDNERRPLIGEFRPVVTSGGRTVEDTACPRDPRYWEGVVGDRGVFIAQLSGEAPIAGLIIDPEMYGAGISTYGSGVCFCEECFQTFLRARERREAPPPAGARLDYLKSRGLLDAYYGYLEDEVAALAATQRERIHAVKPDLLLGGFLLERDDFYHRGLVRGLGAPEMPVLVMPETTYGSGYTEYVPAAIARLKALDTPFLFIGGLWISKFLPDYIGAHAYHMAVNAEGYWLFTTYSLAVPRSELRGDYAVPGEADEYWRALAEANAEIARKARDPAHESALVIRPQPPIMPAAVVSDMQRLKGLAPLSARDQDFRARPVEQLPRLRGLHLFGLLLREGEACTLTLACHQLGSYAEGAALTVTSPSGTEVAAAQIGYNETASIDFTAPEAGVYGVAATAGANMFSLQASAQYFCLVGEQIAFCTRGGRMHFYVPFGASEFTVRLNAGGGQETARIVIHDPAGVTAAEAEDVSPGEAQATVRVPQETSGRAWSLEVGQAGEGVFEDASITLQPPLPASLAYSAERLLVPRDSGPSGS
ncbi:MAG: hypothetical protein JSV65_12850 [Armatimonadota bacterium]|nr:MAG: hypothetical protein JSV65_12850 [Armatimonadota bacterium]